MALFLYLVNIFLMLVLISTLKQIRKEFLLTAEVENKKSKLNGKRNIFALYFKEKTCR